MPDIERFIEAAEARGRGGEGELAALRNIVTTLGAILGPEARRAVSGDDTVSDNLEFNLYEDQHSLDRTDPETWLLAARQHGEDEDPDHEFGDLQDFARAAWRQSGPAEIERFEATDIAVQLSPVADVPRA